MRVGIIGCGLAGKAHARAYRDIPGVSLVAVSDRDASAAVRLAAEFDVRSMSTDQLADSDLDVIDIATPTASHAAWVQQVASQGKHAICETPLARTSEEARAAVATCRKAGVQLFPLHLNAFQPPLRKAREILKGGALGRIGMVRITRRYPGVPASAGDWRRNLGESGGVILEMLSQDIAFLLEVFGPVRRIHAASTAYREIMDGEYALVSLRFENGTIAHLDGAWLPEAQGGDGFEFAGSAGLVAFSEEAGSPLQFRKRVAWGRLFEPASRGGQVTLESPVAEDMYALGLAEIVRSLESGLEPPVSPDLALEVLRVSVAAVESAATGRVIALE